MVEVLIVTEWLTRYINSVKLVLPWLGVCLLLLILDNQGRVEALRGSLERTSTAINRVSGRLIAVMAAPLGYYQYAVSGSERMAALEQRLKQTSVDYANLAVLEAENRSLRTLTNQPVGEQIGQKYIAAAVIDGAQQAMIDKGSLDGVKESMVVLDPQNILVGKVGLIRPHVAILVRPMEVSSKIAVKISGKSTSGILIGKGESAVIEGVLQAETVGVGDVVVTSGADGLYPPNLVIGTIASVNTEAAAVTKNVVVEVFNKDYQSIKVIE